MLSILPEYLEYFKNKDINKFLGFYIKVDEYLKSEKVDKVEYMGNISNLFDKYNSNIFDKLYMLNQNISDNFRNLCIKTDDSRIIEKIHENKELFNNFLYDFKQNSQETNILFSEFLNKFKNSSIKGKICENLLFNILNHQYPNAEIIDSSKFGHQGDFILKLENKPDILFENKDYTSNVNSNEVNKFINDSKNFKCNIFLSQNSGIAKKENFQIDIIDNNILLFIHNVKYNEHIIKLAVNIVLHLYDNLKNNCNENKVLSIQQYEQLKKEYKNFIDKKQEIIEFHTKYHKELISRLLEINFSFFENNNFSTEQQPIPKRKKRLTK